MWNLPNHWIEALFAAALPHWWIMPFAVIAGTFILEDLSTVLVGILVADGFIPMDVALVALWIGIITGDYGLYLLGLLAGKYSFFGRFVEHRELAPLRRQLEQNLREVVMSTRFIPGLRLPTYVACGFFRAPFRSFASAVVLATLVWTTGIFFLAYYFGRSASEWLGAWRWPIAIGVALLFLNLARRRARTYRASPPPAPPATAMTADEIDAQWRALSGRQPGEWLFSSFENWPGYLFYSPVAVAWLLLGLRYRSFTLPLLSNPDIEFGGLCGESKYSVLRQLGPAGQAATAPYLRFAVSGNAADTGDLLAEAAAAGLSLPLIVKPDISRRGTGVRIIRDAAAVGRYLAGFPRGGNVIVQKLVASEGEAGVMYLRRPGEPRGRIVSLTLKYFPEVVGDGQRSLRQLILADGRARRLARSYFAGNARRLDEVIAAGERVRLTHVGNHVRGSLFRDGRPFVTPEMEEAFERISREMPRFHLGRFDVRFDRLSDLCAGRNFTIIEVNGVGSEATHIWDRRARLIPSYLTLVSHVRSAFAIGSHYHAAGLATPTVRSILRAYVDERRLMASYPGSETS